MKRIVLIAALVALIAPAAMAEDGYYTSRANYDQGIMTPGAPPTGVLNPDKDGGDDCGSAVVIASLPFADSGDTTGNTDTVNGLSGPGDCGVWGGQTAGPDQVYEITLFAGNSVTAAITVTDGVYDPSLAWLSTCGDPASCQARADSYYSGSGETLGPLALTAGTYYFYVDSFYPIGGTSCISCEDGTFNLDITGTVPVQLTGFSVD